MITNNANPCNMGHLRPKAVVFGQGFKIREGVAIDGTSNKSMQDAIRLRHKAFDLAVITNTAPETVDNFKKLISELKAACALSPFVKNQAERDAYTKICEDGLRKGEKPSPGDREVYKELIKNPDSLTNAKAAHVQDDDIFKALTSFDKSESDAAFKRVDARFRMNPDLDPNNMALTIANTFKNAERNGQVGSLIGKK